MKAAVIDLGTNTFHLIIAELYPPGTSQDGSLPQTSKSFKVLYKTNIPVRLGQGRINDNVIIPEAFERGLEALKAFRKEIDRYQVDKVRAIATSAVRNEKWIKYFVTAASTETGIVIEVITGQQEAEYIYHGVEASGAINDTSLVMDIGGGSTEFIICSPGELLWKDSYDIGAARLMQAYFKSDPLSTADRSLIIDKLDVSLEGLKSACMVYQPSSLIGSAGAFESFAAMIDPALQLEKTAAVLLDLGEYHNLSTRLLSSSHAEREKMEGLIPLRVDMIVMASLLTSFVTGFVQPKHLYLSTYDLKMGVLAQMAINAR